MSRSMPRDSVDVESVRSGSKGFSTHQSTINIDCWVTSGTEGRSKTSWCRPYKRLSVSQMVSLAS